MFIFIIFFISWSVVIENDCELCVGKDMEGDSHVLFEGIILEQVSLCK